MKGWLKHKIYYFSDRMRAERYCRCQIKHHFYYSFDSGSASSPPALAAHNPKPPLRVPSLPSKQQDSTLRRQPVVKSALVLCVSAGGSGVSSAL